MSYYNSTNTHILATHKAAGGNTRMLLMHECENPNRPYEFVIGSYFRQHYCDGELGCEHWDYEWDWGHYFGDVVNAVNYWNNEVLGEER